jgi:membrane protein DedA with SNARE-associated domain
MEHIQPYLDYFSANPEWAIAVIFLIAFGEALLIIGLFVPSTAVLVGAGMLVGTGNLPFWPVFWATAIGAILGDQLSYWVGRFFGERLKTMWPLNKYPALMVRGEDFVRLHGGKSIAIGRFVPGVKAVVPGIVGMLRMSQPYFLFVNVTSGLFWTVAHVFPGILLGQGLAMAGDLSGHLLVVLLALLVVLGVASYIIRLLAGALQPYSKAALSRLSGWAKAKNGRAWQRFGRAIQPDNPRAPATVLLMLIAIASLVFLIDIVSGFVLRNAASNLDLSVATLAADLRNANADDLMIPITMLAERPVIWTMGLAMAVWLLLWRGWRVAVLMVVTMGLAEIISRSLNHFVSGAGPHSLEGFISTPTLMAGLVFGFLSALAGHAMGRWSKAVVAAICGSVVVTIAFSRIYLGAELFSGILAGGLLALVLSSLFGMAIEAIPSRRIRPIGLIGFASLVFAMTGYIYYVTNVERAEARYAAKPSIITFAGDEWQKDGWQKLPSRRIDLAGAPEEPFTVQWSGSLSDLETALAAANWKSQPKWRWQDAFLYLDAKASIEKLPPRPVLHRGLKAKLTMTSVAPQSQATRFVLRAFAAQADTVGTPIYLISVTEEVAFSRLGLYAMPASKHTDVLSADVKSLLQTLPGTKTTQVTSGNRVSNLMTYSKP